MFSKYIEFSLLLLNFVYSKAYRDYGSYKDDNYNQDSAYDDSINKVQNHQLNNINFEMDDCEPMPFHEPLICRAARCAIDTASIRKILAQPSQKNKLNEVADYYQMTPLHVSAAYQTNNPYPIVRELILMGANISSKGALDRRTPVIETGTNRYGGKEAIRALLEDYTSYRRLIEHHARIKDLSMEKKAVLRETYSKKEVEKVLAPRSSENANGDEDNEKYDPGYVRVVIKGEKN